MIIVLIFKLFCPNRVNIKPENFILDTDGSMYWRSAAENTLVKILQRHGNMYENDEK